VPTRLSVSAFVHITKVGLKMQLRILYEISVRGLISYTNVASKLLIA